MSEWEAVLLGALQGATEFLPVSSSGHLVMGQTLLGISVSGAFFEVSVHLATLLSVLVVYRGRVGVLVRGAVGRDVSAWRYLGLLALATLPAVVVGLAFGGAVEGLFDVPRVVGVALLVTGAFLWTARAAMERADRGEGDGGSSEAERDGGAASVPGGRGGARAEPAAAFPGAAAALVMGAVQALAFVPGISRSGATVVAGLWMGVEAREAAAFSFLMAVPAILGAAVLKLPELMAGQPGVGRGALAWAFAVAALTGIVAIRVFVAMLRNRSFHRFALYCWGAGGGFLAYLALR